MNSCSLTNPLVLSLSKDELVVLLSELPFDKLRASESKHHHERLLET